MNIFNFNNWLGGVADRLEARSERSWERSGRALEKLSALNRKPRRTRKPKATKKTTTATTAKATATKPASPKYKPKPKPKATADPRLDIKKAIAILHVWSTEPGGKDKWKAARGLWPVGIPGAIQYWRRTPGSCRRAGTRPYKAMKAVLASVGP